MTIPFGELFQNNLGITAGVISIQFLVGLVLGFFVKKALKLIIIAAVILGIGSYLGVMAVNIDKIKSYSIAALAQISTFVSVIPFGIGLLIGVVIGLIKG
ncbi:MAG: hypothetical protein QMC98_03600 [Candidatus Thermoplasmatota archaeon]|nr:hypothetical protein [Candidatus Thermoplasmatota archaeon]